MIEPIKKLRLKNFLSYKKGTFEFHPGVNMIIGLSDKGKSAMMDAIYKLAFNKPLGNEFVSWWGGDTEIEIEIDDFVITYFKHKSKSGYSILGPDDTEPLILTALKSSVPDEITRILRISNDLNIQQQLEKRAPIFLLSETPGEAARLLNNIAGLGSIDSIIKTAKEDIRRTSGKKKGIEDQIADKKLELKSYEGIDNLGELIEQAELLTGKIKDLVQTISSIKQKVDRVKDRKDKLKKLQTKLKLVDRFKEIESLFQKSKRINSRLDDISVAYSSLQMHRKKLDRIKAKMELAPIIDEAISFQSIVHKNEKLITALLSSFTKIKKHRRNIGDIENTRKKKQRYFKEIFPDICPLCSSKVEKEKLCG